MEVKIGWATRYGEDRFDVALDEADLRRILHDGGFPVVKEALAAVQTPQAFELLRREAQMLAEYAKLERLPEGSPQIKELTGKIRSYKDARDRQLAALRKTLGLDV